MTMKADENKSVFSGGVFPGAFPGAFPWPNTLAAGWYRPGSAATDLLDAQVMRLQHFAQNLQKAYSDTYSRQLDVFNEASDRMSKTVQELMRCQGPNDLLSTEAQMATVMLDAASQRAQNWFDLGRRVQECCADLAQASLEDLRKQSEDIADETGEVSAEHGHAEHRHPEHRPNSHKTIKAVKSTTRHAA